MIDDVRAVAIGYVESFATGDPDRIAELVTDDFANRHASALGQPSTGRDEYRARLPGFLATFEGLHYEIEDVIVEGDRACVAYRLHATAQGAAGPCPIEIAGIMRLQVRHGRVRERTDYWDGVTFLRQTGQS